MRTHGPLMFHELAPYYDALLAGKDYRAEVSQLESLARRFGRSGGRGWLDVACGTGRHLELLRARHSVMGVDRSAEMLRVARERLPGVRLVRGDMQSFDLHRRFDVVSCLFGAIGNVPTVHGVRRTIANFARHTRPGGVLLLEPWIDPADYSIGFLHEMHSDDPATKVVRMVYSDRRGNRSVTRGHYLVGVRGRGVRHLEETDVRLMVPHRAIAGMMRGVGLHPRIFRRGLRGDRALIVATRPLTGRP